MYPHLQRKQICIVSIVTAHIFKTKTILIQKCLLSWGVRLVQPRLFCVQIKK